MYRLDFNKTDSKPTGRSERAYHPYLDGSRLSGQGWPFNLTLDVLVSGNQNQTRQGRVPERKNRAATMEKQRQSRINDAIKRLRQVLPDDYVRGERMTKAKTLRIATAYIHELTMALRSTGPPMPSPPFLTGPASPTCMAEEPRMPQTFSPCDYYDSNNERQQMLAPYIVRPPIGPFPYYQGHPSFPGRPLCPASPLHHGPAFPGMPPTPPGFPGMPATPPGRPSSGPLNFPEISRAFAVTETCDQYFSYIPQLLPHYYYQGPATPRSPLPAAQVNVASPQPAESDIITVDISDEEDF